MSMRPEQGLEYLEKHGIPHFLESIMIGLVHDRPDDPLSYVEACIEKARELGGTTSVFWDSFLADSEEIPEPNQKRESGSKPVFPTETPLRMLTSQDCPDHMHETELDGSCPSCDKPMDDVKIIFVIGGPGSGKGTQCERIVNGFGYTHFSSGDLLRAEVASGSERGLELKATMERGDLVPLSTILNLIKDNIYSHADSKGFLIDGYPRDVAQGIEFEKTVGPCSMVLWLDVSQDTMVKRLLKRGETSGRVDDNEETIRKRLKTFVDATEPVIKYYQEQNKVFRVDSERDVEAVFEDVRKMFH